MKTIHESEKNRVWVDDDDTTVFFEGTFRLGGVEDYSPITQELEAFVEEGKKELVLNLRKLEFLNSSGISFLAKFVIFVRKKGSMKLKVLGSTEIPWQSKSLPNLKKLFPDLVLSID